VDSRLRGNDIFRSCNELQGITKFIFDFLTRLQTDTIFSRSLKNMPTAEGIVTQTLGDHQAEVVIQPHNPGIVGAPHLNVCRHCASDGSRLTINAINNLDASVGDWVTLERRVDFLKINLIRFLLVPGVGLLAGLATALFLYHQAFIDGIAAAAFTFSGLFVGILYGRSRFGNQTQDASMVITRITKRSADGS
jgi:hypothetical protein